MIAIVDYGVGNVGAVANMFNKIGVRARLAASPAELREAGGAPPEALLLPGVGHFDAGMRRLRERGFVDALSELVVEGSVPVLGICLGMQLFSRGSEEGTLPGLGWIAADTKRLTFPPGQSLVVPHMGWSETIAPREGLFARFAETPRFYYVHSYHVVCDAPSDVAATCRYGVEFTASIHRRNIWGTQFHPEKSHRFGMTLLRSFVGCVRGAPCSG